MLPHCYEEAFSLDGKGSEVCSVSSACFKISKSVPHQTRPIAGWKALGKEYLGTHYVQTIIYGGDLIACIRFKANSAEDIQEVRAIVKAAVSTGSVLDLVGEGKLESLDRQLKRKATMEISYFATVPLEGVPNTIEGLRDLVKGFKDHVKKVNDGIGVPVEVELAELSNFDRGFEYLKNLELETELEFFEEFLDDLLSTKSRLKTIVYEYRDTLTEDEETQLSKLNTRVTKVLRPFLATIGDLDLEKGSYQLDTAKEAYKEGKSLGMAGKFRRDLNRILKKISANGDRFNSCQVIYSQFGLAIHQNDHQARRRFVEWAQNETAVVPDFQKRILFSDEAHLWLNGYVNKQNCRIWSEANPQVYVETPLHPEKLTVWCALWAGGILLQKR
ncbi:uncharacterized protein TNCV_3865171 [Trichonephila clavipes]|nr:uncharacterized protein TNCV_3865171 [Trichonephila clavipes]